MPASYYQVTASIAALEAYGATSSTIANAIVEGIGPFDWDNSSTAAPDNFSIVQATGVSTGRWLLSSNANLVVFSTDFIVRGHNGSGWVALYGSAAAAGSLSNIAAMDVACAATGVPWHLDFAYALTGSTSYSAAIVGCGGVINVGNHSLTLANDFSGSADVQFFIASGSGSVAFNTNTQVSPAWCGAPAVGLTNTFTGPLVLKSKYDPYFSGAVGDGSVSTSSPTDDTSAINAAISYAADQGRILRVGRMYGVTGALLQTRSMLEGNGQGSGFQATAAIATDVTATYELLSFANDGVLATVVRNIEINGNNKPLTISNLSYSGGVVTATTSSSLPSQYVVGNTYHFSIQGAVQGVSPDYAYNGVQTCTITAANQFTYIIGIPPAYVTGNTAVAFLASSGADTWGVDGVFLQNNTAIGHGQDHVFENIYVHDVSRDGFNFASALRSSFMRKLVTYKSGRYGMQDASTDMQIDGVDIGQSGSNGLYVVAANGVRSNIKVWGTGLYSSSVSVDGINMINCGPLNMTNILTQESSGNGFTIQGVSHPINNLMIQNGRSDGDGKSANRTGFFLVNVTGGTFDLSVGKSGVSLLGTVASGCYIDGTSTAFDLSLTTDANISIPLDGAGIGNGHIRLNGSDTAFTSKFDDFTGQAVSGYWGSLKGSDAACALPAIFASRSGAARMILGQGGMGTMAVNGVQIDSQLAWFCNNKGLVVEARFDVSNNSNVAIFFGFTNQNSTLQIPCNGTGSGNAIAYNASDLVGVLYDTAMTTTQWWLVGNRGGTGSATLSAVIPPPVPTSGVYETWRIAVDRSGNAYFFRNGLLMGSLSAAITTSVALTPVIAGFTRTSLSRNITIDFIRTSQLR